MHALHNRQMMYKSLFTGRTSAAYEYYSQMHGEQGIQHCAINSMLYLRTIKDKYIEIYMHSFHNSTLYAKVVRILAKGYLTISLINPLKLQEILKLVRDILTRPNPDYNIVLKRLHLYYNMKLVTFRIDRKRNLIMQFPIFMQPYLQQPLILYLLETVPVPIIDKNTKADFLYTTPN